MAAINLKNTQSLINNANNEKNRIIPMKLQRYWDSRSWRSQ
ncbi:MAG: hypothetical protein R2744_13335 [Bacteroidales bacterium]